MPRQIPKIGDVFLVTLHDRLKVPGQVVETHPILMNSITCAFFDMKLGDTVELPVCLAEEDLLACQFVTRDRFNNGTWSRVANRPVELPDHCLPYRETESTGWVGAKVIGSGIMESFLKAYYGLGSWTEMKDPQYYEKLLARGRVAPAIGDLRHDEES